MCPFRHHATIFGVAIGFYVALASADQGTNVVEMDFSAVPTTQIFGTPVPKTCDQPGQEVTVTVEQGRESDPFTCSSSVRATLTPDDASKNPTEGNTFTKAQCNDPQPLSRVCTGGSRVKGGDGDAETFTLKVPPSGCNPQTLYYCCEFSDQLSRANDAHPDEPLSKKEPCRIKIEIKPASTPTVADADLNPPRGGEEQDAQQPQVEKTPDDGQAANGEQEQPHHEQHQQQEQQDGSDPPVDEPSGKPFECDTGVQSATASSENALVFKCGKGLVLRPDELSQVYKDAEGKCGTPVALAELVNAELTSKDGAAVPGSIDAASKMYTLTVKEAPAHDVAMCYKCAELVSKPESLPSMRAVRTAEKQCMLKVKVKGTSAPELSAATERTVSVLSKLLVYPLYYWL